MSNFTVQEITNQPDTPPITFPNTFSETCTCPNHPNMEISVISLHDSAAKRLFCIECFSGDTVRSPLALKKVVSLSALTEELAKKTRNSITDADISTFSEFALTEVDEIFDRYITQVKVAKNNCRQRFKAIVEDIKWVKEAKSLQQHMKNRLAGAYTVKKLEEGPRLEAYIKSFKKLEESKYYEEVKGIFNEIVDRAKLYLEGLRGQFDFFKQQADSYINPLS